MSSNRTENQQLPILALVVPCYNEEEMITITLKTLEEHLRSWKDAKLISEDSFCCYVDDGSRDATWQLLEQSASADCRVISLIHNVGHQNALLAGLVQVSDICDCSISLDADLQDDLNVIPDMVQKYQQGAEVVYGVRNDRSSDSWFKRTFANSYYRIANWLGVVGIPNHADYRLLSRRAMRVLREYREQHIYLRGIIPSFNLPTDKVYYKRLERQAGEPKYTFIKSLALAVNGLTSFSTIPLRLITITGFLIAMISFYFVASIFYHYFTGGEAVPGWRSILVSLYFLGGLIMFSLGVTGEYIGKIFMETKKRPLYIIDQELPEQENSQINSNP